MVAQHLEEQQNKASEWFYNSIDSYAIDAILLEDLPNQQAEYESETSGEDFGQKIQRRSLNYTRVQPNDSTFPEMIPTQQTATGNSEKVESPKGQKTLHFARFKCSWCILRKR